MNWSELNAKSFYGAAVELGNDEAVMWRMPGDGDFLETLDPDIRRRHEDVGAPEGSTDAIAWMSAMTADDDRPAHWSVTFAVDDTRAIADRTVELNGSVLGTAFDGEVGRIAVLADPQGAAFAVNQFAPEGL
jgi:hypothetical protein